MNNKVESAHPGSTPVPGSKIENRFLRFVAELAALTRDFGMPIIAFATGIYIVVVQVGVSNMEATYKALIGILLVLLGLLAQV